MGFVKALFGGAPKVKSAAPQQLEKEETDIKKLRTALYGTEGGASGVELMSGGTSKRETLFGN